MKIERRIKRLIKSIAKVCNQLGINAYLVGGPVRDLFLGKSNIDLDIVVDKDIENLVHTLAKKFQAEFVCHHRFRTATLFLDSLNIDIATAREEVYPSQGALPQVRTSSLDRDLFRRDFTINAMAMEIKETGLGSLLDPYNGLDDLKNKRIRILHDDSFLDDPTRIIRAIRFETRLNFSLEKKTFLFLKEAVSQNLFSKVTSSRIGNEIIKLLQEDQPLKGIKRLNQICGLSFIHPRIKFDKQWNMLFPQVHRDILSFEKSSHKNIGPWIIYFMLLTERLNIDELERLCQDYELKRTQRLPVVHANYLKKKLDARTLERDKRSVLYKKLKPVYPETLICLIAKLLNSGARKRLFNLLVRLERIKLEIGGKELKKMGFNPGPVFNKILEAVFLAKLDGRISTRREELKFVQENFKQK